MIRKILGASGVIIGDALEGFLTRITRRQLLETVDEQRDRIIELEDEIKELEDVNHLLNDRLAVPISCPRCSRPDLTVGTLKAHTHLCMSETAGEARIRLLEMDLEASGRELERWRHGVPVEGDFVCPNELLAVNACAERDAALQYSACIRCGSPAGPFLCQNCKAT